eukprot:1143511-Pelagomonas_calceolata.AAC.2
MVRSRAQHIYGAACERVDECLSLCMHPACPLKPYSVKHMMHSSCRVGHKVLRYAERQGRKEGQHQLDPPPDVQHIIRKTQEQHEADGGHGCVVVHQPGIRSLLQPDPPLLEAAAQPAHQATNVVVVQQLKADDTQQEHAAHGQASCLGDGPLTHRRAPLVQVLPADPPRGGFCAHQRHQPSRGEEAASADQSARGQQQAGLFIADLTEGDGRQHTTHQR